MSAGRLAGLLGAPGARPALIPYLTAGYPRLEETADLLAALEAGGADAVELGLPFSDPLADGPIIQGTSHQALAAGATHRRILETVERFRRRSVLPVILMGYANPILAYGPGRFFADAASAGADGLIIPDLPVEEAGLLRDAPEAGALSWIFLAAPTSTDARLSAVDAASTDFSYCVSLAGVTGDRDRLPDSLAAYLERAARVMRKPFVVGFGIARAEQIRGVAPPAAGVVVGSALLRALAGEGTAEGRRARATAFVRGLREGGGA